MHIWIITLFPGYFQSLSYSIGKRAVDKGKVQYQIVDLREFGVGAQHITDDRPYGGGPGMIMMIEPIHKAITFIKAQVKGTFRVILTSAKGQPFSQQLAHSFTSYDNLIIICGHYGGVDGRVEQHLIDQSVRVGEVVLTGGEPAALLMIDATVRLIPGVLGNPQSTEGETHQEKGYGQAPVYTRPESYNSWDVPKALLSGNHQAISSWREENAINLIEEH